MMMMMMLVMREPMTMRASRLARRRGGGGGTFLFASNAKTGRSGGAAGGWLMFLYLYHKVLSYRTPIIHPRTVPVIIFQNIRSTPKTGTMVIPEGATSYFRLEGGIQRDECVTALAAETRRGIAHNISHASPTTPNKIAKGGVAQQLRFSRLCQG